MMTENCIVIASDPIYGIDCQKEYAGHYHS